MSQSATGELLDVELLDAGDRSVSVTVPEDMSVAELLGLAREELSLPDVDGNGQPASYRAYAAGGGGAFDEPLFDHQRVGEMPSRRVVVQEEIEAGLR